MRHIFLLSCITLSLSTFALAQDAPANSELVVDESFERAELGKGWHANAGEWKIDNGVLRVKELEADQHAAAARYAVETGNAVYQLKFRFVGEGKTMHFGFDPKRGELKKKGHLFSVVMTPKSWSILKHVDKANPKDDPSKVLIKAEREFTTDTWYTLRVTTWGTYVTATIDGGEPLKASHETFGVKKPALVFRCIGDGVEIDDIKVWKQVK